MLYVIYNNFGDSAVNALAAAFVKKAQRNDHRVVVQNPQNYRTNERIKDAGAVVLIEGAVGVIGAQIEKDYKTDKAKVHVVEADKLESVFPRKKVEAAKPKKADG